ncbi:MAG: hypothetical protein ACLR2E_18385 [Lachnospiraceae bacterium]
MTFRRRYVMLRKNSKGGNKYGRKGCLQQIIGGSCFLYDRYINNGFKVVVSSSDFVRLYASARDALFHRMYIDKIPFFNYPEARRLSEVSLADYLEVDSICKAMPLKDVNGPLAYMDTAIVNNRVIIDTEGDLQKEGSLFISAEDFLLNMDEIVEKD